jgi:hypothetical protein
VERDDLISDVLTTYRGQMMLALNQSGLHMPEKVAIQGLWGKWMFGT